MKRYLLLLAAFGFFLFSSCSNDDDAGGEPSIVATWELTSMNPPVLDFSCTQNHTITFNANGTTNWTIYDSENDCEGTSSSGTWVKNSANSYTISVPDFGTFDGTVTFSGADKFTFATTYQGFNVLLTFEK